MAEVLLTVGGRAYRLACRDGEEAELQAAGALLEARVATLMQAHGGLAEARLLLMAALIVSGELLERKTRDAAPAPLRPAAPLPLAAAGTDVPDAAAFEQLARRAEALAERLEAAVHSA